MLRISWKIKLYIMYVLCVMCKCIRSSMFNCTNVSSEHSLCPSNFDQKHQRSFVLRISDFVTNL